MDMLLFFMEGDIEPQNQINHSSEPQERGLDSVLPNSTGEPTGSLGSQNPNPKQDDSISLEPSIQPITPQTDVQSPANTGLPQKPQSQNIEEDAFAYRADGRNLDEEKTKKRKKILIFASGAFCLFLIGNLIVYLMYFSPTAQAKSYFKNIIPIINNISDEEKKNEDFQEKLTSKGLKFSSSALVQKELNSIFAEDSKFLEEYNNNFVTDQDNFKKLGKRDNGPQKDLYNNLETYFTTVYEFNLENKKLIDYFQEMTSTEEFQKLDSLNPMDISKENLKYISDISATVRLRMEKVEIPRGFEEYDKNQKNYLYLMEQYGQIGNDILLAVDTDNYELYVERVAEIKRIASDMIKISTGSEIIPDYSYYTEKKNEIKDSVNKVNDELKKLSEKYKLTPVQIYIPKDFSIESIET